ncbi:HAD-like domain-containing protein [Chytriomyces sp. MP71]|nr:HAD-like domain-containing protein [Chytriomyces sp. MP71]
MTVTHALLACDIDGTLIRSDRTISERTRTALQRVAATGAQVALVTGRPDYNTRRVQEALGFPVHVIGYNGAVAHDHSGSGGPVFSQSMSQTQIQDIHATSVQLGLTCALYEFGKEYIQTTTRGYSAEHQALLDRFEAESQDTFKSLDSPIDVIASAKKTPKMFILTQDPAEHLHAVRQAAPGVNVYEERYFLDCVPKAVDKSVGLASLCKSLGIPMTAVVAFGDGTNDVEFLKSVGLGIAMKNGVDDVKQVGVAHHVTHFSNDEDGVAIEVEEILRRGQFGSLV